MSTCPYRVAFRSHSCLRRPKIYFDHQKIVRRCLEPEPGAKSVSSQKFGCIFGGTGQQQSAQSV